MLPSKTLQICLLETRTIHTVFNLRTTSLRLYLLRFHNIYVQYVTKVFSVVNVVGDCGNLHLRDATNLLAWKMRVRAHAALRIVGPSASSVL